MEYDVKHEVTDKYSLRGRVFQKLRDDIIMGKFKHGDELKEVAIGEEYGVSRTPVREAFRQLELEGLITVIPNKGAYVNGISAKDVKDIYEIRSHLEGLCARWATENISTAQLEKLEENVYLSDFHCRRGHSDKVAELDSEFHELLYEAAGSRKLEHILKDFHQYVLSVRRMAMSMESRSIASNEEHKLIADAIKSKDADRAEELAHQHIQNAMKNALENGLADRLL